MCVPEAAFNKLSPAEFGAAMDAGYTVCGAIAQPVGHSVGYIIFETVIVVGIVAGPWVIGFFALRALIRALR